MPELMVVGAKEGGVGTFTPQTATCTGAQRIADAHGKYAQAVIEGRAYILDSDTVTLAAANATKAAMGTIKFINGFYNPPSSGYLAAIWNAHVSTVSGTPAGPYFWNWDFGLIINAAATGTIRNAIIGLSGGSNMTPLVNVIVTTNPASTAAVKQLGLLGGPAAIAAGAGMYDAYEDLAGRIIVPPGTVFGLTCTGAGTSHVVQSTIAWEEIPVLGQV